MKTVKIFLASSSELKDDRLQFEILLGRINNNWIKKGTYLELVIWENFLDFMSPERLQNEYNKALATCDIFVMLFFTKVGIYTKEEFETAYGHFRSNGRPYLYTYFKNTLIYIGELDEAEMLSLFSFKKRLKELGHFYTTYANIDELKLKFSVQLDKLLDQDLLSKPKLNFDSELQTLLEEEKAFCSRNNIYLYAANLLHGLLRNGHGITSKCFNQAKQGYAQLLQVKLQNLIANEFIAGKKAKPFLEENWFDRKEVINAFHYAERENSILISEKHLLLGIIQLNGSTIQMIRKDLSEKVWASFLSCLHTGNQNNTPITLI